MAQSGHRDDRERMTALDPKAVIQSGDDRPHDGLGQDRSRRFRGSTAAIPRPALFSRLPRNYQHSGERPVVAQIATAGWA
jgi:hypothetical protein